MRFISHWHCIAVVGSCLGVAFTMSPLHAAQAERRLRPRDRRRFRIMRPARVDMRARKPCLRFRRRTFGW